MGPLGDCLLLSESMQKKFQKHRFALLRCLCHRRHPLVRGLSFVLLLPLVFRVISIETTMVHAAAGKEVVLEQPSSAASRETSARHGPITDASRVNGHHRPVGNNQLGFVLSSMPSSSQFCSELPAETVLFRPKEFMESNTEYNKLYLKQEGPKKRLLKVRFVRYSLTKTCTPVRRKKVSS